VPKENGTLVVRKKKLGNANNDRKPSLLSDKLIETNNIGVTSCVFMNVPPGAKEAGITPPISDNNCIYNSVIV
jgi:hypothetical protein